MANSINIIDTSIEYENIKKWLLVGDIKELALHNRISVSSAYKILDGSQKNFDFLEAAYERAIRNAAKFHSLNERLHTVTK